MCNHEAPSVEAARQRWKAKVDFVGVAWTGTDRSFQDFIDKYKLTFAQISDNHGEVFAHFSVASQPALVIVSSNGNVQMLNGSVNNAELDRLLATATT